MRDLTCALRIFGSKIVSGGWIDTRVFVVVSAALLSACTPSTSHQSAGNDTKLSRADFLIRQSVHLDAVAGPAGNSQLVSFSKKCVDIPAQSTTTGTSPIQWSCNGGPNQNFLFTARGENLFSISPSHAPSLCLERGDSLTQQDCNTASDAQAFTLVSAGGGLFNIKSSDGSLCLDISGASASDGAAAIMWSCHDGDNQKFAVDISAETSDANSSPSNSSPAGTDLGSLASCANENEFCTFSGTQAVSYGAGTTFVTKTFTGGVACNNENFGDPLPGVGKQCLVGAQTSSWTVCANENGHCAFSGTLDVQYGSGSNVVVKSFTNGVDCNNSIFGDPIPGTVKACSIKGSDSSPITSTGFHIPTITIEDASWLAFPGSTDSNSPSFWIGDTFYQVNSNQSPHIASGPNLYSLGNQTTAYYHDNLNVQGRWIEAIHRRPDGVVMALYHREETYDNHCPDRPYFTIDSIGIAKSTDNGLSWTDLGVVLADQGIDTACNLTPNVFFAGGVGDPSWVYDESKGYVYILYSEYAGSLASEGIQIARLSLDDIDAPAGKVQRWTGGSSWSAPGIGGAGQAVLPAKALWNQPNANAYWGPSVHWNTYLNAYVVLMNHAVDANFTPDGGFVSYVPDIADPTTWTEPQKFISAYQWYFQIVGDPSLHGTDSIGGQTSRLFNHGTSFWNITFQK